MTSLKTAQQKGLSFLLFISQKDVEDIVFFVFVNAKTVKKCKI
jgi:hypothetical protein